MQMDEALRLQKEWGNKPCNHPYLEKEYCLGSSTGDWVCTTCGEAGCGRNWNKKYSMDSVSTSPNNGKIVGVPSTF